MGNRVYHLYRINGYWYLENEKDLILEFIKNELVAYCQNGQYICDQVGIGAKKM